MGKNKRRIPVRLGEKLRAIRRALNLSQTGMLNLLMPQSDASNRALISEYERGAKAPDYQVLLKYARAGKVSTDALIDDQLTLDCGDKNSLVYLGETSSLRRSETGASDSLPLNFSSLAESAEVEEITFILSSQLLDECDDLYLDLLRQIPRRMRTFLTREKFYQLVLAVAVAEGRKDENESLFNDFWKRWQETIMRRTD